MPRSAEAAAATRAIPAAVPNTIVKPWWKGPEIRSGKNLFPVSTETLCAGRLPSTPYGASRCPTGFCPRNAANSVATGGSVATSPATCAGTPCAWSPAFSVCGRLEASPTIISEKNTPIDSDVPEFWKVARIPEAAPRRCAGTLPMIAEVLGAENIPWPTPLRNTSAANAP